MAAIETARRDEKPPPVEEESCPVPSGRREEDRLDREKVVDFLREAETIRVQIGKLENKRPLTTLCRKTIGADVTNELEEYEKTLEKERTTQKMNLQKQLVKIHNDVQKFQRHLNDVTATPESIERLKEKASEVEGSINALKEERRLRFKEYLKEERTCSQEVTAYEKKTENRSLPFNSNPKLPAASALKTKPANRDLPAEVKALEDFLQKTEGPHGGWDQLDHQTFLRVWMKHSGRPSYRKEAKLYLPGKTQERMQQHEGWRQELLHLQHNKREAIRRWKTSKDQERQTRIQIQEAQTRERKVKSLSEQQQTEEERMEVAQRLEVWKKEKERKEEEEEEQKLAKEIQRRRRETEKRRQQLEVKMTLEEHLRLRQEKEEEQKNRKREKEQREREEKQTEATKLIKSFSKRDLHKVKAKLHESQQREKEEEERRKRITTKLKEKIDGHVDRDPSRLVRPTRGWEERMKHTGPSGERPMLQMFHRAIPTWRQGL
ncbi:hypothetical protein CRENBAI_023461 [Crenichthys baileyi]|uniref:Coiled-coil domain-containing protein 112 n=1 Tax=Crenichthys baileyi TaxID=28760 RepID=A0AAV9R397_9TELE